MKRSNRIIVLSAVLVTASIATFALTKYEEKKEEIQMSDTIVLSVPTDSIQSLAWNYEGISLAFHKTENGWVYEEDEAFPVNEEEITSILSHFESFGSSFIIENVEDYAQYGLNDPQYTISFSTAEESYEIKLGDFSKMDEQRYVTLGDGTVYLVKQDPLDYLTAELSDMILQDELPNLETVSSIQFSGSATAAITYVAENEYSYSEEDVYFLEQNGTFLPLDTDTITTYLSTISSLNLTDYVTYNATEEELERYGLNTPELSVTIQYPNTDTDETNTCVLHLSQNPEEKLAAEEAAVQAKATIPSVTNYVRIGDSQIVYRITDSTYETLTSVSYDDLRHKEVFWADFSNVTQLDITLENETHTMTLGENDDGETAWLYGETEVSMTAFKNALTALTADSFTEDAPTEKEEIALTFYLNDEHFPQVTIELYRYDGSFCLAVADGKSVSLVERSAVMTLVEAVQSIVLN